MSEIKINDLNKEEFNLLRKYVACRTFLDKYDQLHELELVSMQLRVPGHGIRNKQELHDDLVKYQTAIANNPRLQQALAARDWYLCKKNGFYTLEYRKTVSEKLKESLLDFVGLIESLLEKMIILIENKEFRLVAGGFISGALIVLGFFQPIWFIKILVFVFVSGIVFFLGLVGTIHLLEHFGISPDSKETFTTGKKVVFTCVLLLVFGIAVCIGIVMAGEVRQSSNPYDDREQIYW